MARAALARVVLGGLLTAGFISCSSDSGQSPRATQTHETIRSASSNQTGAQVGFRSRNQLDEHFAKHGAEFGNISEDEYLRAAQQLRERPAGGDVLEIVRDDGSVSRFDRSSGAFLAFNRDGTIRTFFKPNDGERYFRRQAQHTH